MARFSVLFSGRRGTVLSVTLVVWGLALFDLTLIHRQGTPFLEALNSVRLVKARVSHRTTVVTSADHTTPVGPWLLTRHGNDVTVIGTQLPATWHKQQLAHWVFHPRFVARVRLLNGVIPIDVDAWHKEPALFTVTSPDEHATLSIYLLRKPGRPVLRVKLPLPPQVSDRRNFFVATWSGALPDLFVIDRNAQRRKPLGKPSLRPWSISVYSGESRFKRRIEHSLLRRKLSRRLSEYDWWLDVAAPRKSKPNLILVTRAPQTGTGRTEVHMLSGEKDFHEFSLHAATELPQRLGVTRRFAFQPGPEGGSVLMVKEERGQLSLRPIPLP